MSDALNKQLRGALLQMLKNISPTQAEENAIIAAYYQYYKPVDIRRALGYLVDSGYLERTKDPHPYLRLEKINRYKITPKGINLLEGDACDIGIVVFDDEEV
jgi:DNA-binding PadR family transcriptional regulator